MRRLQSLAASAALGIVMAGLLLAATHGRVWPGEFASRAVSPRVGGWPSGGPRGAARPAVAGSAFGRVVLIHDAVPTAAQPLGWSYPYSCCSGVDCRQVPRAFIGEGAAGYTIMPTGEVIAYGDSRIKHSPDGEFHWCSKQGRDDTPTICLFAPPRGF